MKQCEAAIIRHERLSADIIRLTLLAPSIAATARPGQFVNIRVDKNNFDPLLRRPFSIHQTFPDGSIQVVFKVLGKGTEALARAKEGETLDLVGPLGNSFELGRQPICLVGGGLGIAPLVFLARAIKDTSTSSSVSVILGARTRDELQPLVDCFSAMGITPHVATDDGTMGHHGLATDLMPRIAQDGRTRQVCTCGPYPMMRQVAAISRGYGWPCQVSLETMMACGIKACLGCTVHASANRSGGELYLHVCQDGPIFDEGEVAWK